VVQDDRRHRTPELIRERAISPRDGFRHSPHRHTALHRNWFDSQHIDSPPPRALRSRPHGPHSLAHHSPTEDAELFEAFVRGARNPTSAPGATLVASQAIAPRDHLLRFRFSASNVEMLTRIFAYSYCDSVVTVAVSVLGNASLERIAFAAYGLQSKPGR
jgi:hypothetical protein